MLRSAAGLARTLGRMHEFTLHAAGRLAEAEEAYRKALELTPQMPFIRSQLPMILVAQGQTEEALAEAIHETEPVFEWLDRAYARRDGGLADRDGTCSWYRGSQTMKRG